MAYLTIVQQCKENKHPECPGYKSDNPNPAGFGTGICNCNCHSKWEYSSDPVIEAGYQAWVSCGSIDDVIRAVREELEKE